MTDAVVLAELRAVREAVDALREDVNALATLQLGRGERELLAELLPVAAPIVRDAAFTTRDLFRVPTLARIVGGQTTASLSWLFTRSANATIAGVRVRRIGVDRDGAVWQLVGQVTAPAPPGALECDAMEPEAITRITRA